jgi:hypothetical protein
MSCSKPMSSKSIFAAVPVPRIQLQKACGRSVRAGEIV